MHATKYINEQTEVFAFFRKPLGDNGEPGDANVSMWAAPEVNGEDVIVYLETNGDPCLVATIARSGYVDVDTEARDWIERWMREAICQFASEVAE